MEKVVCSTKYKFVEIKADREEPYTSEEANVLQYRPPYFYKKSQSKGSFKRDRSYRRDDNPKKCQKKPTRRRLTYPKMYTTILDATFIKVFTAIEGKTFV